MAKGPENSANAQNDLTSFLPLKNRTDWLEKCLYIYTYHFIVHDGGFIIVPWKTICLYHVPMNPPLWREHSPLYSREDLLPFTPPLIMWFSWWLAREGSRWCSTRDFLVRIEERSLSKEWEMCSGSCWRQDLLSHVKVRGARSKAACRVWRQESQDPEQWALLSFFSTWHRRHTQ